MLARLVGGVLAAALTLGIARGEESPTLTASQLAPVLVTGTRLPPDGAAAGATATVLDERAIARRAATWLPELLRELPGVYVDQAGAPGGFSSLYLRGADPNHTVILLDGVRINDPTNSRGGAFDLSAIDPYDVVRAELAPGAASSIYGSDAMAGVVNLVTGARGRAGLRVGAGFGGRGYRRGYASVSGQTEAAGVYLSGAALDDGGGADAAHTRLRGGAAKLHGESEGRLWSAALRLQERRSAAYPDDSGGPAYAVRRTLEVRDTRAALWSMEATLPASAVSSKWYANGFVNDDESTSPGVAPGARDPFGLPATRSASSYRRTVIGTAWSFSPGAAWTAVAGGELARETGDTRSTLFFGPAAMSADFSLTRVTRSAFAEARLRVSPQVLTELGLRADNIDKFSTQTTGRLRATYLLPNTTARVQATAGTGFKAPSFYAVGNPIVGNRGLRPEKSRTVEIAVASDVPNGHRLAVFDTRYTNLVDFDPGPPPRLVNRAEVGIRGTEYSGRVAGERWHARLALTALSYELPEDTPALRNRPRFTASAGASYELTAEWRAAFSATWRGKVFDSSIPTGSVYLQPDFIGYASLFYRHRAADMTLAVDNVFDRPYEQFVGVPSRGRRMRIELVFPL